MPIDPRIAMSFQAPQLSSPMDLAQNAFALKGAMQQNALADAKMAEMQRQQQSQNALRALFAGGQMPDAAAVYAIDPTAGAEFEQRRAEIGRAEAAAAASEAERAGSQYKNDSAKFGDLLNLISGAKRDPRLYKINIALAKQRGFDVSQVPPEYDENWVNAAEQAVLSVKDRFDIEDRAEQRGISQGQLDVSRGNLKVAQDRLAFDQSKADADAKLSPAEAARQRALGESQAKFETAAPNAISDATQALGLIDQMIGTKPYTDKATGRRVQEKEPHPGFSGAVGFGIGQRYVPGTDAASFQALFDQVQGGAFLQAFETLRGGGAITEKEGAKATAAKNRMSLAQDEKSFIAAAREYQDVLREGIKRAQARLQGVAPTGGAVQVKTDADYDSLPSGTLFVDPNGVQRRKP